MAERDIDDVHPAARELRELIERGGWRPIPGVPDMLVYVHAWPDGSVATLVVRDENDAAIEQTNADGVLVWQYAGGLVDVVSRVREHLEFCSVPADVRSGKELPTMKITPNSSAADTSTVIEKRSHVKGKRRAQLQATVRQEYEQGDSIRTLGERHHRSYGAMHILLSEAGVTFRSKGGNRRVTP